MKLEVKNLDYSYGSKPAVDNVSINVREGEFVGLIGPNGSGKSTVLKNIYRALTPDRGEIYIDGEDLLKMSYKESALRMAVVGQENDVPFNFRVEEIVAMGRTPHKKMFDIDTKEDKEIIRHALAHVGMEDMAKRNYLHLSGGEKQRVIIARATAQECDFLVLDEPTNHLDISYQMQIFDFVRHINATVLAAIHDLNMAALYCDRLYILDHGKVRYEGKPEEVLTPEIIKEIYGVDCSIETNPRTGRLNIAFIPDRVHGGFGHTKAHTHEWAQPIEHEHNGFKHSHPHPAPGHEHPHSHTDERGNTYTHTHDGDDHAHEHREEGHTHPH